MHTAVVETISGQQGDPGAQRPVGRHPAEVVRSAELQPPGTALARSVEEVRHLLEARAGKPGQADDLVLADDERHIVRDRSRQAGDGGGRATPRQCGGSVERGERAADDQLHEAVDIRSGCFYGAGVAPVA